MGYTFETGYSNNSDMLVVRFNANGSTDATQTIDNSIFASPYLKDAATGVVVTPDGKILVSGVMSGDRDVDYGHYNSMTASYDLIPGLGAIHGVYGIARLTSGLSLDTTFGGDPTHYVSPNGKQTTDLSGTPFGIAMEGPYRVVIAGQNYGYFQSARFTNDLSERTYAQHDANHNVTSITDAAGNVLERFVYDPYGAAEPLSAAWGSQSGYDFYDWKHLHQGLSYDKVTGLYDNRRRPLSPTLGFLSADVEGYIDGASRYQYVLSNPVTYVDPSGFSAYATFLDIVGYAASPIGHYILTDPNPTARAKQVVASSVEGAYNGMLDIAITAPIPLPDSWYIDWKDKYAPETVVEHTVVSGVGGMALTAGIGRGTSWLSKVFRRWNIRVWRGNSAPPEIRVIRRPMLQDDTLGKGQEFNLDPGKQVSVTWRW